MVGTFCKVEDWEAQAIQKALDRHNDKVYRLIGNPKNVKISYQIDRNFTVVHLLDGKYIYTGVAKRNPRDGMDSIVGANIALTRAVTSYPVKI